MIDAAIRASEWLAEFCIHRSAYGVLETYHPQYPLTRIIHVGWDKRA